MHRAPEPEATDERGVLLGWLAFHRDALAAKCADLSDAQLVITSTPPSDLTLLGLVRHLTEMEDHYLVRALSGVDTGLLYCTDEHPDGDILGLDATMAGDSVARWHEVRAEADVLLAAHADLGDPAGRRTVRWYVVKLLQEYARHNGHADLIREAIDGSVGE
ncbi:hypothetical protein ASE38_18135 [Cellulomonas sp. Root930]|nr:hypothetical protein ASE38_18135 [Cellulomonas sp. Root930]